RRDPGELITVAALRLSVPGTFAPLGHSGASRAWKEQRLMARQFDAIIIGSGLGGLTAGALYARAGRRVLLVERNDYFGGAATVYRRGRLATETSLHEIDGFDDNDPKLPLLRSLGLERDLAFVDVGAFYEVRSPLLGEPFVMPHGIEAAREATRD